MTHLRPCLGLVACLFFAAVASAHDPLDITVDGRVDAKTLTLRVAMFPTIAAHLAGLVPTPDLNHQLAFDRAQFARSEKVFAQIASTLVRLKTGDTPWEPQTIRVEFTDSEEIQFIYTYKAPAAGRHRFEAIWFARLPASGFRAFFELRGRNFIAARPPILMREDASIDFTLGSLATPPGP